MPKLVAAAVLLFIVGACTDAPNTLPTEAEHAQAAFNHSGARFGDRSQVVTAIDTLDDGTVVRQRCRVDTLPSAPPVDTLPPPVDTLPPPPPDTLPPPAPTGDTLFFSNWLAGDLTDGGLWAVGGTRLNESFQLEPGGGLQVNWIFNGSTGNRVAFAGLLWPATSFRFTFELEWRTPDTESTPFANAHFVEFRNQFASCEGRGSFKYANHTDGTFSVYLQSDGTGGLMQFIGTFPKFTNVLHEVIVENGVVSWVSVGGIAVDISPYAIGCGVQLGMNGGNHVPGGQHVFRNVLIER